MHITYQTLHWETPKQGYSSTRIRRDSSSSEENSPLTPPRPLHPPSAFSDSREHSEAECDRELLEAHNAEVAEASRVAGGGSGRVGNDAAADLTLLLNKFDPHHHRQKLLPPTSQKNLNSIHVWLIVNVCVFFWTVKGN